MRLFHILSPCNTHNIFKTQFAGRCAEAVQKQSGLYYSPGPPNIGRRSVQCIGYRPGNKHSTPTHSHFKTTTTIGVYFIFIGMPTRKKKS